jgi:hypothetical protein
MQSHPRAGKRQKGEGGRLEGDRGRSEDFLKGFRSLVRPLFRDAVLAPWAAELLTRSARYFPRFFDFPFCTKTRGGGEDSIMALKYYTRRIRSPRDSDSGRAQ